MEIFPAPHQNKDTDYGGSGYDVGKATVYNKHTALSPADLVALTCSMCSLILKEPRQVITCGHRYCRGCIEALINGSEGPYSCLVDQEETFQKHEIRNDKGCLRDILSLEVDCPTDPPCNWRGKLTDVDIHRETCPNKKNICSLGCGGAFSINDLEHHMKSECPKRLCSCKHCNGDIPFDMLKEHYGICEEHPVSCNYCQKQLPARKHLTTHLEEDCEEYYMECSHATCTYKGRKPDMVQHVLTKHLIQSIERINAMETKMTALQFENKELREEISGFRSTISDLEAQVEMLTQANKKKDVDIVSLKSIVEDLQEEREERDRSKLPNRNLDDFVERDGPTKQNGRDLYKDEVKVSLKSRPTSLLDDIPKFRAADYGGLRALEPPPYREPVYSLTGVPDLVKPGAEMSHMKQAVDAQQTQLLKLNDSVQSLQDNLTRFGVGMDDVRLRQDVLDVKTTNGILIWKIPDIRRRYRDAVDRRTISLYSPPFYTSPHGYRMCIRTYLNGDGIGKGTHISLFFVIMRSEQDNLLTWPFKQSVRFTLVNQKNQAASITEAFVPDLNSPSFQKPENDMNIASGFPKFARQGILNDEKFTAGNMIYIKCQVDLAGLNAQ